MQLYVPKKSGEYYVFIKYNPESAQQTEFNNIRCCMPIKDFLFPFRELAAVYPEPGEPPQVKEFAVFGLKDCDLRSIEALDKVFIEEPEFVDPYYKERREKMFVISGDCFEPRESCCCTLFEGKPYSQAGFDLNLSKVKDGFIVEAGSDRGERFINKHKELFTEMPNGVIDERDAVRSETIEQLKKQNAEFELDSRPNEVIENNSDSDVFDIESQKCVECQACTRVCPTCHCFYLYDIKQKHYFAKMKMIDSCMRMAYARVAGGENPRKAIGDRIKHRLLHKFSFFLDRYGIYMCVGCGRCIDTDTHKMDIRVVLKKLNEELKSRPKAKVTK
jgi:ferredoxin